MAEEVEIQVDSTTCSCPGCDQPGTKKCSACKITVYCSVTCQTADWPQHKEECPGHLLKVGLANVEKARGMRPDGPHSLTLRLRYCEQALTKLKLLNDRPLEGIDDALTFKTTTLRYMGRHEEAMENAKERYTMWAMTNIRNPRSIWAAFDLIDCCIQMKEYVDAELFASTAYEIINERTDNIIPMDQQQEILARGARYLALATYELARNGGTAPEAKQAAGVKATALAREALEVSTQLFGSGSDDAAMNMTVLADVLQFSNGVDDDEILRLYVRAKAIYARVHGSLSLNVALTEKNLGVTYHNRAMRAHAAHDLDRYVANLQLALPHFREAARIYRLINHAERADLASRDVMNTEMLLQLEGITRSTTATASATAGSAAGAGAGARA